MNKKIMNWEEKFDYAWNHEKFDTVSGNSFNPVKIKQFIAELLISEREEAVKQVRYGNLGRCPVHHEALRCLVCVETLKEDWNAE